MKIRVTVYENNCDRNNKFIVLSPLLHPQTLYYIRVTERWSVIPCWTKCCGSLYLFSVSEKINVFSKHTVLWSYGA